MFLFFLACILVVFVLSGGVLILVRGSDPEGGSPRALSGFSSIQVLGILKSKM